MTARKVSFFVQFAALVITGAVLGGLYWANRLAWRPFSESAAAQDRARAALELAEDPGFPASTPSEREFFLKVAPPPPFYRDFRPWDSLDFSAVSRGCVKNFDEAAALMREVSPAAREEEKPDAAAVAGKFNRAAGLLTDVAAECGGEARAIPAKKSAKRKGPARPTAQRCRSWEPLYNLGVLALMGDDPGISASYYAGDAIGALTKASACLGKNAHGRRAALTAYALGHALWRSGTGENRDKAVRSLMTALDEAPRDLAPAILNDLAAMCISFPEFHACANRPQPSEKPSRAPRAKSGDSCQWRDTFLYASAENPPFEGLPGPGADADGRPPFSALWNDFYDKGGNDDTAWNAEHLLLAYGFAAEARRLLGGAFFRNPFLVSNTALIFCYVGRYAEAARLLDRYRSARNEAGPEDDASAFPWNPRYSVMRLTLFVHILNGDGGRVAASSEIGGAQGTRAVYARYYEAAQDGSMPFHYFAPLGKNLNGAVSADEADLFLFIGKWKADLRQKGFSDVALEYDRVMGDLKEAGIPADTLKRWWADVREQVASRAYDRYGKAMEKGESDKASLLLSFVRRTEGLKKTRAAGDFPHSWGWSWWVGWATGLLFLALIPTAAFFLWWARRLGRAYVETYSGFHHESRTRGIRRPKAAADNAACDAPPAGDMEA